MAKRRLEFFATLTTQQGYGLERFKPKKTAVLVFSAALSLTTGLDPECRHVWLGDCL